MSISSSIFVDSRVKTLIREAEGASKGNKVKIFSGAESASWFLFF